MSGDFLPAELIRRKRDGEVLADDEIEAFVRGAVDGTWGDAQLGAFLMACVLWEMQDEETLALTRAMTESGERLSWEGYGPIVDKHSTGGVGDKVSLILAPVVAAAGGHVPMISGRGLGHTGGTLDKLESIPGYSSQQTVQRLREVVGTVGCAIVGATANLAPADGRLYAIRDVTATVSSIPLITASILSKKLAAGLGSLVMDVKVGNGAFMETMEEAQALAQRLVDVAALADLPTRAWITDMNQVLGHNAGNALEVREVVAALCDGAFEPRLREVVVTLSAEMLVLAGLATTREDARETVARVLANGEAAERFARMVAELGGPVRLLENPDEHLPAAPHRVDVLPNRPGVVVGVDVRALGLVVVRMGGGRARAADAIDPAVGLAHVAGIGDTVGPERPLAMLHARSRAQADDLATGVRDAFSITDVAVAPGPVSIQLVERRS